MGPAGQVNQTVEQGAGEAIPFSEANQPPPQLLGQDKNRREWASQRKGRTVADRSGAVLPCGSGESTQGSTGIPGQSDQVAGRSGAHGFEEGEDLVAKAVPLEAEVVVGGIFPPVLADLGQPGAQDGSRQIQQGPPQTQGSPGHLEGLATPHATHSRQGGPTQDATKDGLRLIIVMMPERDPFEVGLAGQLGQSPQAFPASPGFQSALGAGAGGGGRQSPAEERHPKPLGQTGDPTGVGSALGTQPMINVKHGQRERVAGGDPDQQAKEGNRVGPPGHRHPQSPGRKGLSEAGHHARHRFPRAGRHHSPRNHKNPLLKRVFRMNWDLHEWSGIAREGVEPSTSRV